MSSVPSKFNDNIRCMLLLRVCFQCPPGRTLSGIHGGWLSYSAQARAAGPRDMGWPIEQRLGRFHLVDTIDGYLGTPYSADEEFDWMLKNCTWRVL
jgi:hypothetical protein